MAIANNATLKDGQGEQGRRVAVMQSALSTFARHGYRKASMEDVARDARISRPGLYFLFRSKKDLFREVVEQALTGNITEADRLLSQSGVALNDRLVAAFDQWAGRYVGPLARDVATLVDQNPELLRDVVGTVPQRFADLVTAAIAHSSLQDKDLAPEMAQTLISISIGLKHQATTRDEYVFRLRVAINLLLR